MYRLHGVVPVPLHHLRTSHPKFTDSSNRDLLACLINDFRLGVRNGQSNGMLHRKTAWDVAVRHRRSLRKTVSLYNKLAGSLLEFLEEFVRECGPTANAELRRCEVFLSRGIQEFPHEQRDHCDHGRSFLMNEREQHLHIAGIWHEHHTSTDGQANILRDRHSEHMKERKRCQKTLSAFGRRKP